jgi:hypothetical protein
LLELFILSIILAFTLFILILTHSVNFPCGKGNSRLSAERSPTLLISQGSDTGESKRARSDVCTIERHIELHWHKHTVKKSQNDGKTVDQPRSQALPLGTRLTVDRVKFYSFAVLLNLMNLQYMHELKVMRFEIRL